MSAVSAKTTVLPLYCFITRSGSGGTSQVVELWYTSGSVDIGQLLVGSAKVVSRNLLISSLAISISKPPTMTDEIGSTHSQPSPLSLRFGEVMHSKLALRVVARYASTSLPRDVYICSAARTPIGSIGASLAKVTAPTLGTIATKGAIERAGLSPEDIEEVYFGNVISAGMGQSPARQVALGAGCTESTEATTINKVCASGMKAVMMAAQNITLGRRHLMVAGGTESMSNVPYILRNLRYGASYGHQNAEDLILGDGLTDVYNKFHMGMCGEDTATKLGITREECDAYALESYRRSADSAAAGLLAKEIVPVNIPQRKGDDKVVDEDEEYKSIKHDRVPTLRAVFKKDGIITAANASTLNDGAAALVLASEEALGKYNLTPLAKIREFLLLDMFSDPAPKAFIIIPQMVLSAVLVLSAVGFADAARAPIEFPIAPALATPLALEDAGVSSNDISRWEVNEAFAVVALANIKLLNLDPTKVNINGGAVSIGHPIGMSGARIVGSLVHHLDSGELGCASICNGGGAASAIVIEKI
eukprot:gene966-4210_t